MKREKVYLIDQSGSGYRIGKPAEIIGFEMVTPDGLKPRLCYHLRWDDFMEDWKPVNEGKFKIVTFRELLNLSDNISHVHVRNQKVGKATHNLVCPLCRGTGRVVRTNNNSRSNPPEECPVCNGRGRI